MSTVDMSIDKNEYKGEQAFRDVDPETRVRTKKMMMYIILFAVVMLFAGFTSGYIVMAAGKYMVHMVPPTALYGSIVLVIFSSITMWLSASAMKKGNKSLSTTMLTITFILGLGFTFTQYQGWQTLTDLGMGFTTFHAEETGQEIYSGNKLEDLSGVYGEDYWIHKDGQVAQFVNGEYYAADDELHTTPITHSILKQSNLAAHFLVVLIYIHIAHLLLGLVYMVVNLIRIRKGIIHQGDTIRLSVNGTYWHFMGLLWIYLFVFLFVIH